MNNQRIIVITHRERNEKTGRMENIISHGVLEDTSKNVILENAPLSEAKALGWVRFEPSIGEYILVS